MKAKLVAGRTVPACRQAGPVAGKKLTKKYLQTPWSGVSLVIEFDEEFVWGVGFSSSPSNSKKSSQLELNAAEKKVWKKISGWFEAYFQGKKQAIPLDILNLNQGTEFQQKVWQTLASIPFGETISYKQLAQKAKRPGAFRAAGSANGKNPFPIIVPCHRVINADGGLGGYSCGIAYKKKLLEFERV